MGRQGQPILEAGTSRSLPRTVNVQVRSLGVILAGAIAAPSVVHAQSFEAFAPKSAYQLVVPVFTSDEVTALLGTLDRVLAAESNPSKWPAHAEDALWQFARRLQAGRLAPALEARVVRHLEGIGRATPEAQRIVQPVLRMVRELTVGKVAPDIVGTDLDGVQFKLSDFRGQVVALVFSAEWCAICRAQAPYERFLVERYRNFPFALLGVETGSSIEAMRRDKAARKLEYRSWWDVPGPGETMGPIAAAWNVVGWPAVYLIDGDGVIRFVDLRSEDLLKGVRQVLDEQLDRNDRASRTNKAPSPGR